MRTLFLSLFWPFEVAKCFDLMDGRRVLIKKNFEFNSTIKIIKYLSSTLGFITSIYWRKRGLFIY